MSTPVMAASPGVAEEQRPALLTEIERLRSLVEAAVTGRATPASARARCAVDDVADRLGLSAFERDLLLLAAAVELDGEVARLVQSASGAAEPRPTFALAFSILPGGHWDALSPERPLRRWLLLDAKGGGPLALRPLTIDEHVLHLLTGLTGTGRGPEGLAYEAVRPVPLTAPHALVAAEIAGAAHSIPGEVLVRFDGDDPDARIAVAADVAERLGLRLLRVRDAALADTDLVRAATLLDREALLGDRLLVTAHDRLLSLLQAPVVVTVGEATANGPSGEGSGRTVLARTVDLPGPHDQARLWWDALDEGWELPGVGPAVNDITHHYRLSARGVAAIAGAWRAVPDAGAEDLRRLTRERARVGLGDLADRVEPYAGWADLVVPEGIAALLQDLTRHARHRSAVYDDWGFSGRSDRGFGVTALFAGESGTGKTMAAEVVARDLGLDLYRIELSAVVSKYIGETEKNLRRVFDAAEAGGAVLLFDEADALFGKRSEVKDSHDRYANLEVAYLLQRMEHYRGVAILTTNLRSNVDRAFLRRLRFVLQFPFPDATLRAALWRGAFPAATPTEGLDPDVLAVLQVTGGSIRAMAVAAAFAAAHEGVPVRPEHVLHAAKVEYAKAERNLTETELRALVGLCNRSRP